MQIVADIGGSQAKWAFIRDAQVTYTRSAGFNPLLQKTDILTELLDSLPINKDEVINGVHLYGAGFVPQKCAEIKAVLQARYPDIKDITLEADLLGACRAYANKEEAIVIALGTGACHAHFDGDKIAGHVPSLGYVLGDEGSGHMIGKGLLELAIRKKLAPSTQQKFEEEFGDPQDVLVTLYHDNPRPASYLASFARFAGDNRHDGSIHQMLENVFDGLRRDVLQKYNKPDLPHIFTGSISHYFSPFIDVICHEEGIKNVKIENNVIKKLVYYHLNKESDVKQKISSKDFAKEDVKDLKKAFNRAGDDNVLATATTEGRPDHRNIQRASIDKILDYIIEDSDQAMAAIKKEKAAIKTLIEATIDTIQQGGRIFYIGAGSSGRYGVVDAAECPPTFGVEDDVIGIIAGGDKAMTKAVEGAEDDKNLAWEELKKFTPTKKDMVIGLAASGRTPYVIGGLEDARRHGLKTGCVVCNSDSAVAKCVDFPVAALVGAAPVSGSTRMGAGTAQKVILNMISTTTLTKMGYVYDNVMVNMKLSNKKLEVRAIRNVTDILNDGVAAGQKVNQNQIEQIVNDILAQKKKGEDTRVVEILEVAAAKGNKKAKEILQECSELGNHYAKHAVKKQQNKAPKATI